LLLPTSGKIIGTVGNNVENFSALWATTWKNAHHCGQQQERIATKQISKTFLCEPLSTFKGTVYLN
jgi:hypothetical protein